MPEKIVLYIRTKEHVVADTPPGEHIKSVRTLRSMGTPSYDLITTIDCWLSPEELRAKKLVEGFAKRHNLELVIRDRAGFRDNLRARVKGIKTTPTVVLGKRRFGPEVTAEVLEAAL